ncbi:MAG: condensation domain-containing protein, partial [Flammeovirgaceae bacterium]
ENTIFPDQKTFYLYLKEEETTELLQKVPKAYHTQINDILLTALTLAIGDLTQDYSLSLILEGHGREDIIKDIDLSRTIGWFTSIFPVHLKIKAPNNVGEAIRTVKETLQEIPNKGIGKQLYHM